MGFFFLLEPSPGVPLTSPRWGFFFLVLRDSELFVPRERRKGRNGGVREEMGPKTEWVMPISGQHPRKRTPKCPSPPIWVTKELQALEPQPVNPPYILGRCQNSQFCPHRGICAPEFVAQPPEHSLALEEAESEGEMSEEPSHCRRLMRAWLSATSKLSFSTLPSASGRDLGTGVREGRWGQSPPQMPGDAQGLGPAPTAPLGCKCQRQSWARVPSGPPRGCPCPQPHLSTPSSAPNPSRDPGDPEAAPTYAEGPRR